MQSTQDQCETIFIVDPHSEDYQQLTQQAHPTARIVLLTSAEEALSATGSLSGLWIVNSRLPDMTGVELCEQLKLRIAGSPVVLVADQYNADDELAALCAGSLHFTAKPLSPDWLSQLAPALSSLAFAQTPLGTPGAGNSTTTITPSSIQ